LHRLRGIELLVRHYTSDESALDTQQKETRAARPVEQRFAGEAVGELRAAIAGSKVRSVTMFDSNESAHALFDLSATIELLLEALALSDFSHAERLNAVADVSTALRQIVAIVNSAIDRGNPYVTAAHRETLLALESLLEVHRHADVPGVLVDTTDAMEKSRATDHSDDELLGAANAALAAARHATNAVDAFRDIWLGDQIRDEDINQHFFCVVRARRIATDSHKFFIDRAFAVGMHR
jgi:hypothetical protein